MTGSVPFESTTARTADGFELPIRIFRPSARGRATVLLLHGASASSETFEWPRRAGFLDHLLARGASVVVPEWRGGHVVAGRETTRIREFTLDAIAEHDVPTLLRVTQEVAGPDREIAMLAHCVGGGVASMTIGGRLLPEGVRLRRVAITALGLFYQVPWHGWVKALDQMLERLSLETPTLPFLHPGADADPSLAWPEAVERVYQGVGRGLVPAGESDFYRRLSFMFGEPYRRELVPDAIHRDALPTLFGALPLALFIHGTQNIRRGFAAPFDDVGQTSRTRRYLDASAFAAHEVLLVTGARNSLWHRDSIDRMATFLRDRGDATRVRSRVLPRFAHQDLFWSEPARDEVYPLLADHLLGA